MSNHPGKIDYYMDLKGKLSAWWLNKRTRHKFM